MGITIFNIPLISWPTFSFFVIAFLLVKYMHEIKEALEPEPKCRTPGAIYTCRVVGKEVLFDVTLPTLKGVHSVMEPDARLIAVLEFLSWEVPNFDYMTYPAPIIYRDDEDTLRLTFNFTLTKGLSREEAITVENAHHDRLEEYLAPLWYPDNPREDM